jgi:hypothetical protein
MPLRHLTASYTCLAAGRQVVTAGTWWRSTALRQTAGHARRIFPIRHLSAIDERDEAVDR